VGNTTGGPKWAISKWPLPSKTPENSSCFKSCWIPTNYSCYLNNVYSFIPQNKSRDSLVGIATGCRLDGRRSIPGGQGIFLYTASKPALRPSGPPIQWVPGALSPKVKRLGRETDHPSSTAEVTNCGATTPLPHTFHGVHRHKFVFIPKYINTHNNYFEHVS
jgi:hypothetical protein